MKDIKLIVSDLDGTLLNNDSEFSEYTLNVLEMIHEKGIRFVPVSGRGLYTLLPKIKKLKHLDYFVAANGAVVYQNDLSIVECFPLNKYDALRIYETALRYKVNATFIIDGFYFDENGLYELVKDQMSLEDKAYERVLKAIRDNGLKEVIIDPSFAVHKATLLFDDMEKRKNVREELSRYESLHISNAKKTNLEISSSIANKGNALTVLAKLYDISLDNVLALGDANNDIPMFEKAGTGIAMLNSIGHAKEYADFISQEDNQNDGAARMIEMFCLTD